METNVSVGGTRPGRSLGPALFVPLGALGGSSGGESVLEIVHPDGFRVRVIGDVNVVTLGRVLPTPDERGVR